MRMDIVGVAIARAEHAHANERGGRPEKRSSFHADEFLPAHAFCQPKCGCDSWAPANLLQRQEHSSY